MKSESSESEFNNFVHNISWLRKYYGISKKKMAQLLGIGIESLNRIENGEIPPKLGVNIFFNIHKNFGIPPKDQLGQRFGD